MTRPTPSTSTARRSAPAPERGATASTVAGLLLVLPSVSYAGKMSVQFDFSGSSLSILGGFINVPPDGAIIAGSGQIDVGAAGIATPGGGAAALKNLSLAGTLNKSGFGVIITGVVAATQPGTATGALSGGLGNLAFNPFLVNFTGFANCINTGTGTGCTILGLPTTLTGPKTFSIPSLAVANLGTVGNAVVNSPCRFLATIPPAGRRGLERTGCAGGRPPVLAAPWRLYPTPSAQAEHY